jgi:hypothetical protein
MVASAHTNYRLINFIMSELQQPRTGAPKKVFTAVVLLLVLAAVAWLAMTVVQYAPTAFSSLASLADRMQGNAQVMQFVVTSDTKTIDSGETTTLTWAQANAMGSYTFSYACAEGVAVTAVGIDGDRGIACDTTYNLGSATELTITATSEKAAYEDINYTISFLRQNSAEVAATAQGSLLIVNETLLAAATPEPTEPGTPAEPTPVASSTPAEPMLETPARTTSTTPTRPTTPPPTTEIEYLYAIPVSDPNGTVDLATRFLNTGRITNNRFAVGALIRGTDSALQFEVRNLGTKTSQTWTYQVVGPDSTYTSPVQTALKPSERAVITVGFPGTRDTSHNFIVTITTREDRNRTNDRFVQPVSFQ